MQNIATLQNLYFMRDMKLRVAVLGGTFDPAHNGHLMISTNALKSYQFDYVIWLVANQNPLKKISKNTIFDRAKQALSVAHHPKIIVSVAEHDLGTYYIYDSLKSIINIFPTVEFTWLMGIDNATNFRRWYRYDDIVNLCDIVVFDRPVESRLVNIDDFGIKTKGILDKNQRKNILINRQNLCAISSTKIRNDD